MPYVYLFLPGRIDGHKDLAGLLGNKGAHLAEMARMGLPVPPGFTISTEAFRARDAGGALPPPLRAEVATALDALGRELGFRFGDPERPLLVSVRGGAAVSMPGMMSTVTNVGLTSATLPGLLRATNDPRFVYDTFRRFIETYAREVLGRGGDGGSVRAALAERLDDTLAAGGGDEETLSAEQLERLCDDYLSIVKESAPRAFPDSAEEQLWGAIEAVFRSWDSKPAVAYRERRGVAHDLGTAVTVQAMVFGNLGSSSGACVLFTRDPVTGRAGACGEWLPKAQGEDVVGGLITPHALGASGCPWAEDGSARTLEEAMPDAFTRLLELGELLEGRYLEVQEIECILQEGRPWVLQTRAAGMSRVAVLRAAVEMAREGLITPDEAVRRTEGIPLDDLLWELEPDEAAEATPFARGRPASVGVASGAIALTADRAEREARKGRSVILVRDHVAPEDIHGIDAADGLVANRGGMASHLAVTARAWNKPCVVGCATLSIDERRRILSAGGVELREGDEVTVDANGGFVYRGRLARRRADDGLADYVKAIRRWGGG